MARPVGAEPSVANGIAVDSLGGLIVGGGHTPSTDLFLVRLLSTGIADPRFGTDGLVLTDTGATESATDVAIAPDGKIVVSGQAADDRGTRVLVARYTPGATLDCLPTVVDLGAQVVGGASSSSMVTCTNTGPGPATVTSVGSEGADSGDFMVTPDACLGVTLASGGSCQIAIRFAPTGVGARSATLRVTHSGDDAVDLIALRGTGTEVFRGTPAFVASPDPVMFGELLARSTSLPRTVTVTNVGTEPFTVTTVSIGGPAADDVKMAATTCSGAVVGPISGSTSPR